MLVSTVRALSVVRRAEATSKPALEQLAQSLLHLGRKLEAVDVLSARSALSPSETPWLVRLGDALADVSRFDDAAAALRGHAPSRMRPPASPSASPRSTHPHDSLVHDTFEHPEHVRGELQHVLGAELAARLDWSPLELVPGSFIDPALENGRSDLLFRVMLGGPPAYLYLRQNMATSRSWPASDLAEARTSPTRPASDLREVSDLPHPAPERPPGGFGPPPPGPRATSGRFRTSPTRPPSDLREVQVARCSRRCARSWAFPSRCSPSHGNGTR